MKFIHIADVHLGVQPDAEKPWGKKRAQDIWNSLEQVITVAEREEPDFLFITGDLFHRQPLKKEVQEVNALFKRIPRTKVLLLAGNHDYLRPKSYYLTYSWAENIYIFRQEEVGFFDFPKENVTVYGLSYWHREIRDRLYDSVVPVDTKRVNVLLVHGGDERHIPFSTQKIIKNGFDYLAAGHIHRGSWLAERRAVMAGSLEPTDCNDLGPHGYWMGTVTKRDADIHFFPVKNCEYCHETYVVQRETTEREIRNWVKSLLEQRPDYQYFRLFLEGRKDPEISYNLETLEEMERIVDVTAHLRPDYDYEKLLEECPDSLLGAYIRRMNQREAGVVTKKALEYGVNALLGYKG